MTSSKKYLTDRDERRLNLLMKFGDSSFLLKFGGFFALIYHCLALIFFYLLRIRPMFYFNIFSVLLYTVIVVKNGDSEGKEWSFHSEFVEVLVHSIVATILVGSEPAFYYMILPISIMGMLIWDHRFVNAAVTGFIAMVTYILIVIWCRSIQPIYPIDHNYVMLLRYFNVAIGVMLIFLGMFAFSVRSAHVNDVLSSQIRDKSMELTAKSQKVSQIQKHMIYSLANLVENRDEDTGKHVLRTSKYVEMIAVQAMRKGYYLDEIDGKFVDNISNAAPLHDIGKITVPDYILKKPGKLTSQEFNLMKTHSLEGARIVKNILDVSDDKDYAQMAVNIAEGHHEKWDGSGYPHGLSGLDIPLSARIMAVADVFDALISTRCYKQAMSYDEAFSIIENESGKHFDPVLVEVFLSMKDRIIDAD